MNPFKIISHTARLEKIKKLPRYQIGSYSFGRYKIKYNDSLAFYNEFNDIFKRKIYHFGTFNTEPIIIDAGGYIGLSVLYFKKIYPNSKITVIEPNPSVLSILKENISNNKLEGVELVDVCLGRKEGKTTFYLSGSDGGSVFSSKNSPSVEVKVKKLSTFINAPVDLLKMNIEGLEGDVFEEIEDKLSMIREVIFEYHCFNNLDQNLGKILNILDRNHFRYLVTDGVGGRIPIPFRMASNYKHFNLVYAKREPNG